ncbi:unnamed protein product [marine sediment metagenome]|uniref:Uncharacterized protein n=1 Tax=marine sediment metagenome TaxID=412755 RepID=X1PW30_9ZZZZ
MIYTIKDIAEADPSFTVADDLYKLETQNYPLWNGEKLVHDPTLTIYYDSQESGGEPSDLPGAIPGFNLAVVLAVVSAIVPIQIIKRRKEKKP